MKISSTAEQFKNEAERIGAYLLLQLTFPGKTILIPYYNRMGALSVDEMSLSVRSRNALMRAGAHNLEQVANLMEGNGLKALRNLGVKSEKEILRSFFSECYVNLSNEEKLYFWQGVLDRLQGSAEASA